MDSSFGKDFEKAMKFAAVGIAALAFGIGFALAKAL